MDCRVQMTSNCSHSKDSRIDVDQSEIMNEDQMEMFLNVRRSHSDQSMLGKIFGSQIEPQRPRPLIISLPTSVATDPPTSFKLFRKIKKDKKKNESDYCKNICGYITKKILRELCSPNYSSHVKGLCGRYQCQYQDIKRLYLPKIEQVTGPSHIPGLLKPENPNQQPLKSVFKEFFEWFLRTRYLRYLLRQGKMADKKAYIKYKNYMLLAMVNDSKPEQFSDVQELKVEEGSEQQKSVDQNDQDEEEENVVKIMQNQVSDHPKRVRRSKNKASSLF